jgi:hypothetical protein
MATTNQRNRSGGQKGGSGHQSAGQSTAGKSAVQKVASQASDKIADLRDDVSDYMSQGREQMRGHEGQAVLVALAAGFGVGLVIGCSLVSANRRPKTWSDRIMAEGIGRKFMDRVESMIPEAVSEHFHR